MRVLLAAAILSVSTMLAVPASAQTVDIVGPHNPYCGTWQNGVFVPNGNCIEETAPAPPSAVVVPMPNPPATVPDVRVMQRMRGTITSVSGHLVTIQEARQTLVVNDSPALSAQQTGRVAVGRQVTVHGYWQDGTFFATRIE